MKCFNWYSEFLPTLSKPICQECDFCYYCRDFFFSCFHYDTNNKDYNYKQEQQEQEPLPQSPCNKKNIQNCDLHKDLVSTLTACNPEESAAVIVIDDSLRHKLGRLHILEIIQKMISPKMNCYVDVIPTGIPDNDIIKVFDSYVNIPTLILTSDSGLYRRLPAHSLFVMATPSTFRGSESGIFVRLGPGTYSI